MSVLASRDVLRPGPGGLKQAAMAFALEHLPLVFRALRAVWPIPKLGKTLAVTRYDDVREVFLNDSAFAAPYKPQLDVIMGGEPFFLGMGDTPQYRADTDAMRKVIRTDDIPARLAPAVEAAADKIVTNAGGRLEVVDALVRRVTFDVLGEYFGVPNPPNGDLRVWATRLFEFQFVDQGPEIRTQVKEIAPALRNHVQAQIEQRRASGVAKDDVLGRCLEMQSRGEPGFSDEQIRTALMGFVVGGPPQPPMVVPQALEQLLRRPDALAGAQDAARGGDDKLLAGYVFEAMRFDPLAPFLPRVATRDTTIAAGTPRAASVPKDAKVYVAFSSAMMDERRLPSPKLFNPRRLPHEYIHFGHGLHQCFGIHINKAVLPLMLKPLLKRKNLRRAQGSAGHLRKLGAFAHQLYVEYD
jgi:cytochrome P450